MSSTILNIINEVRANVSEPSTISEQFYSNQELIYYIRRSINDICIDTDANFRFFSMTIPSSTVTSITFASICDTSAVTILDLREIIYRAGDDTTTLFDDMPRTNLKTSLALAYDDNRDNKQTCYIEKDTINLTSPPEASDIIMVAGRWEPVAITSSSDTYPLGAMEEDASIKYTTSMCWLKKNKVEIATAWMNLYNDRKKTIELKKKRLTQATYPSGLSLYKQSDILNSGTIREITP